ncbi:hypothetical protein, partial [Leptospira noguchii]|uniref:hypothetical protein n=1 Tax=Leptospira noguchii TaxID=28182 RepID=UPI001E2D9C4E
QVAPSGKILVFQNNRQTTRVASSRPIRQNFSISKQPTNNSVSLQVAPSDKILVFQNNIK